MGCSLNILPPVLQKREMKPKKLSNLLKSDTLLVIRPKLDVSK